MKEEKTREELIALAKTREKLEDDWVKDNNIILDRDSCENCIQLKEGDTRNSIGNRCFCSSRHAYEVSNIKTELHFKEIKQKLLSSIDTSKMSIEEAEDIIQEIEGRYY